MGRAILPSVWRDEKGAAYVEFLMAFVPLFILFLGIAQVSLLFGARLVVEHAAERAARAAAVVLPDDPRHYDDEPMGAVSGRPLDYQDLVHALSRLGVGVSTGELSPGEPPSGPPSRRSDVTLAAALTVMPLAPQSGVSLGAALGSEGVRDAAQHTMEALDVQIEPGTGEVVVRVEYRYECVIPVARGLVCAGTQMTLTHEARATIQAADVDYAEWWTGG
jgi:hypothetical protein